MVILHTVSFNVYCTVGVSLFIGTFIPKWKEMFTFKCNDLLEKKKLVFKSNRDCLKQACDPAEGALNKLDLMRALLTPDLSIQIVMLFATKMEDTSEQSPPDRTI